MDLSVVVPFFNEEEVVEEFHGRLSRALDGLGLSCEAILVDDGSTDRTPELLRAIAARDPRARVVLLRRNFGQTPALAAGFDRARGKVVVSMDGDLQHDPAELPRFLERIEAGFDVVSGWRKRRVDSLLLRRLPSAAANRLMFLLSGVPIHDFGTTYKAYRREVLEGVDLFGELHRFIPALASRVGARITEIPVANIERPKGRSKYGLRRVFGVFSDLLMVKFLISYLYSPLRVFGALALLHFSAGLGLASGLMAWWALEQGRNVFRDHGGLLLFSVLLMVMGVQFFTLGVCAEMISRIYHQVRRQPIYHVREELGGGQGAGDSA